ncbi:BTB domain-containing protein [Mycena chlorophos]|uniref:BTB domain-containing protein n=1 Tax=Mycena chlorophos TaxID=658473 RepID=A0A8H6VWP8_MYCCL|nr:BTB domain-containing protein [Mycena chlorophos]
MSDLARTSSPLSSSPGRNTGETFERPTWPWQSRYAKLKQTNNVHFALYVESASVLGSFGVSDGTPGVCELYEQHEPVRPDENIRQWSFMGFEWVVRDVHKLRDFVEGIVESEDGAELEADSFEVLKGAPLIGDDKFKLEIARPTIGETSVAKPAALTLYITSLLDFAHNPSYEMSSSIMVAIKSQDDRVGARAEWVWEFWHSDWIFRHEAEVWDCSLPPISALLENGRIRDADSFTIAVQIHCPLGPFFPQQPTAYYVPRDLLEGLEASLDNPNTGDVRFVCLERMTHDSEVPGTPMSDSSPRRPSSSTSSHSPFATHTTARKRVIYAHSDILTRRSDYFATMLSSSFAETKILPGDRKIYTIVVEEADFETIYWLLKYCYANWLHFKENDDPRSAVEGIGAGWSARWLSARGGEWDWKTFSKVSGDESTVADARSATSADSVGPEATTPASSKGKSFAESSSSRSSPQTSRSTAPAPTKSTSNATSTGPSRQPPATSSTRRPPQPMSVATGGMPRSKPVPISAAGSAGYSSNHYPISPRTSRSQVLPAADPHPHPTSAPAAASALSIYQVAHRYAMPSLAALALDHMMSTITPSSAFGLLLATSVWDELRSLVEDYVVEKWDEVSTCPEFELCCREVSAGE